MADRMSGKYCVVTGAARGIGKAIAVMPACHDAPGITGSELNIDGGILAGSAAAPGS